MLNEFKFNKYYSFEVISGYHIFLWLTVNMYYIREAVMNIVLFVCV